MKKFLLKIIIYSTLILGICFFAQYLVDEGLRKCTLGNYGVWNEIFGGRINTDILVQGSSRALVQIDPQIIENYTGLSCYNIGIPGGRFIMQKAKWDSYIANNKPPKILIQNVDIMSLRKEDFIFDKAQFLPYLSKPTISSNLEKIDSKIWLEKVLLLYKYRGFRAEVFLGLRSYFDLIPETQNHLYHGYAGVDIMWNQDFAKFKAENDNLIYNTNDLKFGFNHIEKLMQECRDRKIEVILIHTPIYSEALKMMPQKQLIDSLFINLTNKYSMQYWDYTLDSLNNNKEYFYNATHLNIKGAEIFSNHLAKDIGNFIRKNKEGYFFSFKNK